MRYLMMMKAEFNQLGNKVQLINQKFLLQSVQVTLSSPKVERRRNERGAKRLD